MATPAPAGGTAGASVENGTEGVSASEVGSLASLMHLLPFQRHIIHSLIPGPDGEGTQASAIEANGKDDEASLDHDADDPDALVVMARGLGMRTIIASILRLYAQSSNLVVVVNASAEEEAGLSEELSLMGVSKPGLQIVGHETNARQRREKYLSGGLFSVTSRILVVDMLQDIIPTELITGLVVMHAERISPTCVESFIAHLYRDKNQDGFLKAFSDSPEYFAMGLSPLQTVLTQLRIRRVELWPRFHKAVIKDLSGKKAKVAELHQQLSQSMKRIQNAIVECLEATLGELKRGSGSVDIEDATVENAIFRAFEAIVRRQLDPVWHRIGPKTKRLVSDLHELRNLLNYLLSYDAVKFHRYLETILSSQTSSSNTSAIANKTQSPWLMMEAANVIFSEAKARIFIGDVKTAPAPTSAANGIEDGIDQDEEDAAFGTNTSPSKKQDRPWWLPPGIEPTLEELPKWHLLRDTLQEIEENIHLTKDIDLTDTRNNTVLIMVETEKTCLQLREFLSTMRSSILGRRDGIDRPGRTVMERQLKNYFAWKSDYSQMTSNLRNPDFATTAAQQPQQQKQNRYQNNGSGRAGAQYESEALKRKEIWEGGRAPLHKRRRQRGGAVLGSSSTRRNPANATENLETEAEEVATFMKSVTAQFDEGEENELDEAAASSAVAEHFTQVEFESFFGLLKTEDLIIVRPYSGDDDDHHLQELKPRFVIMYDLDAAFIRRLEVFRSAQPRLDMNVYFLIYSESVEEQRYLSDIRREKESFERLIGEKARMALPLQADGRAAEESADERLLRTINSRLAGGQQTATREPPRVIVDMREFRSSLPYMLHRAGMRVVPCTLQVGDYIITSTMCVERKSLTDLIQSFNSGRLYTQCELMSVHYQHPILLIEFDQGKAFSLQSMNDSKAPRAITTRVKPSELDIQTKLVMLTNEFHRLRVIWSSSPYETSSIFAELKQNYEEPDEARVAAIGLDADQSETAGVGGIDNSYNLTPQDILLALPGITTKNYRLISNSVRDLEELCEHSRDELCGLIGAEAGRRLHDFIHKNVRS